MSSFQKRIVRMQKDALLMPSLSRVTPEQGVKPAFSLMHKMVARSELSIWPAHRNNVQQKKETPGGEPAFPEESRPGISISVNCGITL